MPVNFFNDIYINNPLKEIILGLWSRPVSFFEIALILFIIWKLYGYIKGTQAEQLLKGVLVIILALLLSLAFKLVIISKVLEYMVNIVIFGAVVIFQPELRRMLGHLGQSSVFSRNLLTFDEENSIKTLVSVVTEADKHLSKTHTGALIVLEETSSTETFIEVGTPLDADVSVELILTIFHPNTPLHDGAIVINGTKVVAAGVLLPLTEDPKLSWQYGTRHRAAIGMTEVSRSMCVVVSEETGEISLARNGTLKKLANPDELKKNLETIYEKLYPSRKKVDFSTQKLQEILPSDLSKISNFLSGNKKK